MRKALFVVNPISGGARHGLARAACLEALGAAGVEVEVLELPGPGETARAIGEYQGVDFEALLAGGGDGTVREVAEVASRLELPLGIIPLGTSNSVARELGLPLDPVKAARVAAAGKVRVVDMAQAGPARFLLCAGVGFDAEVIRRVHAGRRGGISVLSYVPRALSAFFSYPFPGVDVVVDGVPAPPGATQVVIANARVWGGWFHLAREARIDDGLLDVVLFYGGRFSLTRQVIRAFFKRPMLPRRGRDSGPGAIEMQGHEVFIPGSPAAPFQIDGDMAGSPPLSIKVLPGALKVIAP